MAQHGGNMGGGGQGRNTYTRSGGKGEGVGKDIVLMEQLVCL